MKFLVKVPVFLRSKKKYTINNENVILESVTTLCEYWNSNDK